MKIKILLFIITVIPVTFFTGCDSGISVSDNNPTNTNGTAGSMARFALAGNYLYTVELTQLKIFNLDDEKSPVFVTQIDAGFGIETIFARDEYLFLGSNNGIYIYSIQDPENPQKLSMYSHVRSCDPVVVSGNYAYATLRTESRCSRGLNQLHVINVSNKNAPFNVRTIEMENPKGLGISGNFLYVCDEDLKIYNISNPESPVFIQKESINAFDVIPINNLLIVVSSLGLFEYEIKPDGSLNYISSLYSKNI